jgi:7-cyano-7-deazaguanine synthase
MNKDSVILFSGGMDSTVLLHEFKDKIKLAISFYYGSKHNHREQEYALKTCLKLGIPHKVITMDFSAFGISSNLLKSGGDIPHGHYEDESMKQTVVPFRNGIMLSIASGIAESIDAKTILIANHAGDHAIYPDCREDFIHYMSKAISKGTYNGIEILAPFKSISKRSIALEGKSLGIDFNGTYSCYEGDEIHCGECGTCVERKEALEGFDNTEYKK